MSSTTQNKRNNNQKPPPRNKTQKNKVSKMCDLGNTMVHPCCTGGRNCHVKPEFFVANTRTMTRSASKLMNKEHDNYKRLETKIFGRNLRIIPCVDAITIQGIIARDGIIPVKQDRAELARLIKMRTDWLDKWYLPPTATLNCYICDANATNHIMRINNLKKCLRIYDNVIANHEKVTGVASRTRANMAAAPPTPTTAAAAAAAPPTPNVAAADDDRKPAADDDRKPAADDDRKPAASTTMRSRPRLNLTKRKKDNYEKIDSITRRQILVAMLAKKKESQERRRLSSEKKKKASSKK